MELRNSLKIQIARTLNVINEEARKAKRHKINFGCASY